MLNKPNPSSTTLYSSPQEIESHAVRFVIAKKNIESNIINVQIEEIPEEILELNPGRIMPTLFDRGMVLYDLSIIMEYLDERYPFPPLLPVDPIEKAEKRLFIFRFTRAENNWYKLVDTIQNGDKNSSNIANIKLTSSLIDLIPLFAHKPYFKSNNMTIVDACLAPVLWRLKKLNIRLNAQAKPIIDYSKRLFAKESFKKSLTDCEKEYR